ncbi:hypothetical protein [Streptomyces azureus]|uniref:Putative two-component response regulator n=1 Tax=Streptomyces azureus TaxID=146537 RepID=A0A0K8PVS9_STRAJ|nr:hypothetical protein [Streptomyces azureus]GAP52040.1 putative two-component response regulator [Streptomyces azureus]
MQQGVGAVRAATRGDALACQRPGDVQGAGRCGRITGRLLREPSSTRPEPEVVGPLTEREPDMARLVAVGRVNQKICEQLVVSLPTVKHLASIQHKTDAAWAWESGVVREREGRLHGRYRLAEDTAPRLRRGARPRRGPFLAACIRYGAVSHASFGEPDPAHKDLP